MIILENRQRNLSQRNDAWGSFSSDQALTEPGRRLAGRIGRPPFDSVANQMISPSRLSGIPGGFSLGGGFVPSIFLIKKRLTFMLPVAFLLPKLRPETRNKGFRGGGMRFFPLKNRIVRLENLSLTRK